MADGAALFKRLTFIGVQLLGVADVIDTEAQHGKLNFTIKNLVSDLFLDDLRDKTIRGLEGRQLAGLSTGNPPFGYRTTAVLDAQGREIGKSIQIDEDRAAIIRRIFDEYLAGMSLEAIAKQFCKEQIPPPRANTRHRRKGWVHSTIRVMLHNEKYIGVWRFKEREWVKVPGENRRVPRARDAQDVMVQERPHLRIIDEATWQAVRARLKAVRATYTRNADGSPKGRSVPGRMNHHVLSGLLTCAVCGEPITITGGGSTSYFGCADHRKRGTCRNDLFVKESIAQQRILEAVQARLASPEGLTRARKRLAEKLGELSRTRTADLRERRDRLARTEARIAGLVGFIADGDRSEYVVSALRDLEAQARAEKAAISDLQRRTELPIRLPSPEELQERANVLYRAQKDPVGCREWLRRVLDGGGLTLEPQADRVYLARGGVLPFVLLAATEKGKRQPGDSELALSSGSSGGRI